MDNRGVTDTSMSHLVGLGIVFGFLLPHTSTAFLLVNPMLCILYQCYKSNRFFYKNNWLVVVPIIITLLVNIPQGISSKSLTSCFTILLYFVCFPIVGRIRVPNGYLYFILVVILLSQLAYLLNIPFVTHLLDTYYPVYEMNENSINYMRSHINTDNVLDYRLGGLYRRANICSKFLSFLLVFFLITNSKNNIRSLLPFIIICFLGVVLTGSRTGFIVSSLVIIVFLFVNKSISSTWRIILTVAVIVGFIVLLFWGPDTVRGANLQIGGGTSLKRQTFLYYLSSESSIFRILIGYLDTSRFDTSADLMSRFDSDYGSIIFSYGIIGFISILVYFFTIFFRTDRIGRLYFILLLWMYSSTIVKSFRALFVFMLLMSLVYNNHKRINNIYKSSIESA